MIVWKTQLDAARLQIAQLEKERALDRNQFQAALDAVLARCEFAERRYDEIYQDLRNAVGLARVSAPTLPQGAVVPESAIAPPTPNLTRSVPSSPRSYQRVAESRLASDEGFALQQLQELQLMLASTTS